MEDPITFQLIVGVLATDVLAGLAVAAVAVAAGLTGGLALMVMGAGGGQRDKKQREILHKDISHCGYDYKEILRRAKELFGLESENKMNKQTICEYLNRIVQQPINRIGRDSNMLLLGIGEKCSQDSLYMNESKTSAYILRIQSAWRIENKKNNQIILASSDMYSPQTGVEYSVNFDWEPQGSNLFDEKSQIWMNKNSSIFIQDYKTNLWGDLLLFFSNGERLMAFVDVSDETECWEIFAENEKEPHLIITGLGYDIKEIFK